jgi:hypothetical protein
MGVLNEKWCIEGNLNTFTDRLYSIKANLGKLSKYNFIGKQQTSLADFRTRLDKKIGELQTRMSTLTEKHEHLHRQSIQVSIRIIKEGISILDAMLSTPTVTSTRKKTTTKLGGKRRARRKTKTMRGNKHVYKSLRKIKNKSYKSDEE